MFDKNSKERQMFADFYKLCEKFWKVPLADKEYYDAMIAETHEFQKKYETGDGFAISLHDAIVDRAKRIWREQHGAKEEKAG